MPLVPHGWYYVAPVESMRRPVEITLGNREYVAFAVDRQLHVLDGRCAHFGAHLARGNVVGHCLECPLHGWRFRGDGRCDGTPSGEVPPEAARLDAYPVAVLGGHLFFHTDPAHTTPAPFFADASSDALISAPPFAFDVEMPWWMVSTNGFDAQHFLTAHDRKLVGSPEILRRDDHFEARASFEVVGTAWRDRVTHVLAGPRSEMTVRNAGAGALILVTSRFGRTTTYGLVSIHPRSATRSHVRTIVWMHPRTGLARGIDAIDVRVRASFIRAFIEPDIVAGEGIQFDPRRTIGADALVSEYLAWLAARARPAAEPRPTAS